MTLVIADTIFESLIEAFAQRKESAKWLVIRQMSYKALVYITYYHTSVSSKSTYMRHVFQLEVSDDYLGDGPHVQSTYVTRHHEDNRRGPFPYELANPDAHIEMADLLIKIFIDHMNTVYNKCYLTS